MKYIENELPLLQYQVETISINKPTGLEVERIENMTSVRDISWQNDSDHITITTDDQVHNIIILCQYSMSLLDGDNHNLG